MKAEMATWQDSVEKNTDALKDGMERLHGAAVARDEYVDSALDKHSARLDRQRRDMSGNYQRIVELREENRVLREELQEQKVLIESMSDRLCNCRSVPIPIRSPASSSGLSYAGSD
jgi:predicted RNase H-like nuclease (RuvC/YqgF family)